MYIFTLPSCDHLYAHTAYMRACVRQVFTCGHLDCSTCGCDYCTYSQVSLSNSLSASWSGSKHYQLDKPQFSLCFHLKVKSYTGDPFKYSATSSKRLMTVLINSKLSVCDNYVVSSKDRYCLKLLKQEIAQSSPIDQCGSTIMTAGQASNQMPLMLLRGRICLVFANHL